MSTDDRGWSDEEQLVQYLAEFGFNRNEARMYLAALGRGPLRVAELAELADVNRPKAYDALRQLVDKGLFEPEAAGPEQGQVARFKAVDPMLVVQRLRHQSALEQADRVQDTALLVADLFAHYYEAPQGDDPFEYVELIRNSDAAWARRDAITAGAEKEVVQARRMTPPGTRPRAGDEVGVREGVSYRALYETGFLEFPQFMGRLAEREQRGEQIRFIDAVPIGMTAVDRRKCLLSLNPTGLVSGQGSWVVLEQPALTDLLTAAFDLLWDAARPGPR
ncbi:MAG TPA: helix-turn-helix domain-containing protein [Actinomycetes bacterium]|jgi:predicted DNA-binding transcriptional regulator|nr:helix-turn-helix domain-containing protein [Actinomycetes bacterium]